MFQRYPYVDIIIVLVGIVNLKMDQRRMALEASKCARKITKVLFSFFALVGVGLHLFSFSCVWLYCRAYGYRMAPMWHLVL